MQYRLDLDRMTQEHNKIVEEIDEGCCKELNTARALRTAVSVGDFVVMNDHEDLISVVVVREAGNRITVMDRQGFIHECERWMFCECTNTLVLRSLVSGESKVTLGYSPTIQKGLKWSSWVSFFNPFDIKPDLMVA